MVCVSVFIALSSFMNLAFNVIKVEFQNQDYNIHISYRTNEGIDEKMKEVYNLDSIKSYSAISSRGLNFTTDKYSKEYLEIHPEGGNSTYTDEDGVEHTIDDYISVYSVNTEEFTRYVKSLGLKYEDVKDKGILINNIYETKQVNSKYIEVEIPKYTFKVGDTIKGYIDDDKNNTKKNCSIEIAKITTEVPMGMSEYQNGNACIFIDGKLGENIIDDSYYR